MMKENEIKQWSCDAIGYKWEDTNKKGAIRNEWKL